MVTYSVRDEIIEIVNRLFVYTDNREWMKLQSEVFTGEVYFDMSSVGGEKGEKRKTTRGAIATDCRAARVFPSCSLTKGAERKRLRAVLSHRFSAVLLKQSAKAICPALFE